MNTGTNITTRIAVSAKALIMLVLPSFPQGAFFLTILLVLLIVLVGLLTFQLAITCFCFVGVRHIPHHRFVSLTLDDLEL